MMWASCIINTILLVTHIPAMALIPSDSTLFMAKGSAGCYEGLCRCFMSYQCRYRVGLVFTVVL